jgi:hypothetical protein
MNYLDDTHMAQITAAATKRAQAEDWRTTKPTKHAGSDALLFPLPETPAEVVRAELAGYLTTPAANPRVMVLPERTMQDALNEADKKHLAGRRFDDKAPVSAWGELA